MRRYIIDVGNDNDHLNEKVLEDLVRAARQSGPNRGGVTVHSAVVVAEERQGEFQPIKNCVRQVVWMFGLSIQGGYCNILTIGRPGCLEAPIYFMKTNGRSVNRWTNWGWCAEQGEGAKARDKASIRIGDKPWQFAEPDLGQ